MQNNGESSSDERSCKRQCGESLSHLQVEHSGRGHEELTRSLQLWLCLERHPCWLFHSQVHFRFFHDFSSLVTGIFFFSLLPSLTSHIMYCHLRGAWSSFVPFDLKKPNAHIHNINYLYFLHHDLIPVHALFSFAGSPSPPRPPVQRCSLSPCPPWNQYRLMDSLRNNETWIHWETTHYYYLCYIQLWVKWALGLAQESYQHLCYFHEKSKAFQILTKSAKALF